MLHIFDIVILIGVICGPLMILGSMFLLYKGSISLQAAANDKDALSIELMKEIKLSTRYPALGLFLIGFMFFITSANYAQEGSVKSVKIIGNLSSPDGVEGVQVEMSASSWRQEVYSTNDGGFSTTFRPNLEHLKVVILAAGYENDHATRNLEYSSEKILEFGAVNLGKRVIENVQASINIPNRTTSTPETQNSNITTGSY